MLYHGVGTVANKRSRSVLLLYSVHSVYSALELARPQDDYALPMSEVSSLLAKVRGSGRRSRIMCIWGFGALPTKNPEQMLHFSDHGIKPVLRY